MSNIDEKLDNLSSIVDITAPGKAMERRFVTGVAISFSSSFVPGVLYEVANESNDSVVFMRFDGGSPSLAYGAGASFAGGVPVMPLEKFIFRVTGSSASSMIAIVSGSANITVFDHS